MMNSQRALALFAGLLLPLLANPMYADTCQDIEGVINKSRSLEEVRRQGQALKLSPRELRGCERRLAGNQKLRQLLDGEKQRLTRASRSRQSAARRQVARPEQLTINSRVVQLRAEAKNKLISLQRSNPRTAVNNSLRKPSVRKPGQASPAPQPQISSVTPATLVPGTDVVIEGSGFGNNAGTVVLKLQGKTFTATINAWNDTWVNAYLGDSIGGVQPSDNAVLSVQVPQAGTVNRNVPFIPLYVQKSASEEYDSPGSLIFPGSGTTTVFLGKHLNNGWRVTDYSVAAEPTFGECELGTPSMSVGGERVESQLKWSYDWWQGFAWCYVNVYAEGPQGTSGGL